MQRMRNETHPETQKAILKKTKTIPPKKNGPPKSKSRLALIKRRKHQMGRCSLVFPLQPNKKRAEPSEMCEGRGPERQCSVRFLLKPRNKLGTNSKHHAHIDTQTHRNASTSGRLAQEGQHQRIADAFPQAEPSEVGEHLKSNGVD